MLFMFRFYPDWDKTFFFLLLALSHVYPSIFYGLMKNVKSRHERCKKGFFFFHIVQIKIYQWILKKTLLFFPLHSRSPLQRPCNSSFHCVRIIDLPSNFLKGSWAPQGQDILSFEEKKTCSKMFIFLPFVQFMLLTARRLFPEEDA